MASSREHSFAEYFRKSTSAVPGISHSPGGTPMDRLSTIAEEDDDSRGDPKASVKVRTNIFLAWYFADTTDYLLMACGFLSSVALGVFLPLNISFISDGFGGAGVGNLDALSAAIKKIAALGAGGFAAGFVANASLEMTAERQVRSAKLSYFTNVCRQEIGYFDTTDIGTLASDVETSCVKLREGIGMKSGLMFKSISTFIAGYTVALTHDWKLALVLSSSIPLIAISFGFLMKFIGSATEKSKTLYTQASSVVEESLGGIRTVSAFDLQKKFVDKFVEILRQSLAADMTGAMIKSVAVGIVFLIIFLSYGLAWWYGGMVIRDRINEDVITGRQYSGTVMATIFSVLVSAFSLGMLSPTLTNLAAAAKAVGSIKMLVTRQSLINPTDTSGEIPQNLDGKIEVRRVRFTYPSRPDRPVYGNLTFDVKAGEQVALVGPSGAGKSTIIQLLMRFYDPTEGSIFIDGVEVRQYNLQWLREQIGLVQQEPRLFCTTIYENIACGKRGATREEVIQAAKAANAHDFISNLADGYNTTVGPGGGLLSGGQKQRIAIARAILRNPRILLLDEATSALDNESERVVQEALDNLLKSGHRTTFVIAHRLTTIRNADKIFVLENVNGDGACVVQDGTHEELMSIEGLYKRLVEAQSEYVAPKRLDTSNSLRSFRTLRSIQSRQDLYTPRLKKLLSRHSRRMMSKASLPPLAEEKEMLLDTPSTGTATWKMWKRQLNHWKPFAGACGAQVFNAAAPPANSLLVAEFLSTFMSWDNSESASGNADRIFNKAKSLALIYVFFAIGVAIFQQIASYFGDYGGHHLAMELRASAYQNMIYQDMEFFDDQMNNVGALSAILSSDCEAAKVITGQNFQVLFQTLLSLVIAIIIAFASGWKLALLVGGIYGLIVPIFFLQAQLVRATAVKTGDPMDAESAAFTLNELVINLRTVAAYGLQNQKIEQYGRALQRTYDKGKFNAVVVGSSCAVTESILYFASASSYRFGVYLMDSGQLTMTNMMRANLAVQFAGGAAAQTSSFTNDAKRAKIACENIFDILEKKSRIDARSGDGFLPQIRGNFVFDRVKFRYPGRPNVPVLKNVSFEIKEGETVALVGQSGSGKSTIVQFVLRFYDLGLSSGFIVRVQELQSEGCNNVQDPHEMIQGKIKVDGTNIQDVNISHLRAAIGYVGQEPVLFDDTIAGNIRDGNFKATQAEIEAAARQANAHDFIEKLPEKYYTNVGKGGSLLSGGQKQRIAIARAIVRDPKILVLDEATSALDSESEKVVQAALDDMLKRTRRTTIVVAHRLSTIRQADKIVVFKPNPEVGSEIAEIGSHESLMRDPNGIYRQLVEISNS